MTRWVYEIHIVGHVSASVLAQLQAELGDVVASTQPVTTVISGQVPDQAGLIGLLDLMHALGLNVCEARRVVDLDEAAEADLPPSSAPPRSGEPPG